MLATLPAITTPILATDIVNDFATAQMLKAVGEQPWLPAHPALALLRWEDERTDVHAVVGGALGTTTSFACACGYDTGAQPTALDASAALISHALNTCAVCHGPKPSRDMDGRMDTFPRCSRCAF